MQCGAIHQLCSGVRSTELPSGLNRCPGLVNAVVNENVPQDHGLKDSKQWSKYEWHQGGARRLVPQSRLKLHTTISGDGGGGGTKLQFSQRQRPVGFVLSGRGIASG